MPRTDVEFFTPATDYEEVLQRVLSCGERVPTRTTLPGENGRHPDALSLPGLQYVHDFSRGFPAITCRKLYWGSVVKELLWFLRGETNIRTLGCGIWSQWADEDGECPHIYPEQWRRWKDPSEWAMETEDKFFMAGELVFAEHDQIGELVQKLRRVRDDPGHGDRRRMVVSAWNPPLIEEMALPPCHTMFQLVPYGDRLEMHCTWRSTDVLLGMPFNIASYSLLLALLCELTGFVPRALRVTMNDAHMYDNQLDAARRILNRYPRHPYPRLWIDPVVEELAPDLSIEQCGKLDPGMFELLDYRHHGVLPGMPEVAV